MKKREIKIYTYDEEEQKALGKKIHEQLVGNPDYKNNKIGLNIEDTRKCREVFIWMDDCEFPELRI